MACSRTETGRQSRFLVPAILLLLLLGGCAGRPWTGEPLEEQAAAEAETLIRLMQEESAACSDSLDADALLFWKGPMEESAIQGYLQLAAPSLVKLLITNPLGQPLYAFASNGEEFQSLDTQQRQHIRGSVLSLAVRKEIPTALVGGDWFAYLTARLPKRSLQGGAVFPASSDKTLWLQLPPSSSADQREKAYVHIDPLGRRVLGYLFRDDSGKTLAEISYPQAKGPQRLCAPPNQILVSDLPWGSELKIELHAVRTDVSFTEKDFSLPVPPGFATQLQP